MVEKPSVGECTKKNLKKTNLRTVVCIHPLDDFEEEGECRHLVVGEAEFLGQS